MSLSFVFMFQDDQYERPTGLFDGKSSYQAEYNKHYDLSETARPQAVDHSRSRVIKPGAFDGHTTTREHYKHWVPQPTFTFGDLPSFTASILYPDNKRHLETTTQTTFRGQKGDRSTPFKLAEAQIAEEGRPTVIISKKTYQGILGWVVRLTGRRVTAIIKHHYIMTMITGSTDVTDDSWI